MPKNLRVFTEYLAIAMYVHLIQWYNGIQYEQIFCE